jgi:hypothetical protein
VLRNLIVALFVLLAAASGGVAQEWATKMFNTVTHDFKSVAAGAKAEYRFQIKNLYEEDVHVKSVRSSCGCTTPLIVKPDLKTFEVGEIVAEFNTKSFIGHKEATITVVFDKPFYAEVPLRISGFIRSDVVFQPGAVDFGTVDVGSSTEKRVAVNYAGRSDWSVLHAKVPEGLETELVETARGNGQVTYELLVRLSKNMPAGYIQDQILLVTNDARNREIPLDVAGRVVSEIVVNPSSLFMGVVQPGQQVTKQLIVRGKRPFKIIGVKCDDASFEIAVNNQSKALHRLPIVFTAGDRVGKITQQIAFETDQGGTPALTVYAHVVGANGPVVARANPKSKSEPAKDDDSNAGADDE